jgi:hypothetical protein
VPVWIGSAPHGVRALRGSLQNARGRPGPRGSFVAELPSPYEGGRRGDLTPIRFRTT